MRNAMSRVFSCSKVLHMNYQTLCKGYFNFRLKIQTKRAEKYCKTQEVINEFISRARDKGYLTS